MFHVTCHSEQTRNYEECPESDEESLITSEKLTHGDVLLHSEVLPNYLEQEDESTSAKNMLTNLRSEISQRVK